MSFDRVRLESAELNGSYEVVGSSEEYASLMDVKTGRVI